MDNSPQAAANWPVSPASARYGGAPDGLILAGGIVGVLLGAMMLLGTIAYWAAFGMFVDFAGSDEDMRDQASGFFGWLRTMVLLMGLMAVIGIVGGATALAARSKLQRSGGTDGKSMAVVGAALMLVGGNLIAGSLGLVGALLVEGPAASGAASA